MRIGKVGDKFGDWTIEEWIGEGGNGFVWRVSKNDGTVGALKILSPWVNEEGDHYFERKRFARFRDEMMALRQCQDIEGVLPLLDSYLPENDTPLLEDPPWLVLALAVPLETALGDAYLLVDAVNACASIANTLSTMHSRGFSHRDVKPDNLFRYDERWCLGDFGLASFEGKSAKTSIGERLGPRFYIADEMLNNAANADDTPADVYSLAKTLWKLGTGQAYPLQGTIRADEPSMRLSTYTDDQRAFKLDPIIEQATKHDPRLRITMSTFASELSAWLKPHIAQPSEHSSLSHLVPRIEGMQGNFRQEQQYINKQNAIIESKVREFLDSFKSTFTRILNSFAELFIEARHTPAEAGRKQVWFAEMGEQGTHDAEFFQTDITAFFQKPPSPLRVTLLFGVCVRIPVVRTDYGRKYQLNGAVQAAAAITINRTSAFPNQDRLDGVNREFVLGGPHEGEVVQEFSDLFERSLANSVEAALTLIEAGELDPRARFLTETG